MFRDRFPLVYQDVRIATLMLMVLPIWFCSGCSSEDRVVEKLNSLISRDPDDPSLYFRRGKRFETIAEETGSKAEFQRALEDYTRAVELAPNNADYRFNQGNACLSLKNYPRAIKNYEEAISLNPEVADYHNNLGMACAKNMQFTQAVKHFGSAIFLEPDNADFYIGRALAYWEQGEQAKGRQDYHTARRLDPEMPEFEEFEVREEE